MPGRLNSIAQCVDVRRDEAQVFGDERQAAERLAQCLEQFRARALHPPAVLGRRLAGRDVPSSRKPAEVVEADEVDLTQASRAPGRSTRRSRPCRIAVPVDTAGCPRAGPVALK